MNNQMGYTCAVLGRVTVTHTHTHTCTHMYDVLGHTHVHVLNIVLHTDKQDLHTVYIDTRVLETDF